jgi:hypothetical protein
VEFLQVKSTVCQWLMTIRMALEMQETLPKEKMINNRTLVDSGKLTRLRMMIGTVNSMKSEMDKSA